MIGSDQNFNYANIENHEPTRNLLDSFISSGFIPTITKPTRITHNTSTLIDNLYIKIKQPGELISGILNIDISDHLPIFTFIGTKKCTKKAPKYIVCRPMDEEKFININNDLNNIDWAIIDNLDIDDAYNLMVSKILNALNSHAPEKTIKISYKNILRQPWMTSALLKSSRTKNILFKKCLGKSKESLMYRNFIAYRNTYNRLKRISKQNYYTSELAKYKHNTKKNLEYIEHINWEK